ncbi:MAG: GTP-binding protein [Clostridiales bacterium]|nr:GTP-binding protein [Clostridiales bacterium]
MKRLIIGIFAHVDAGKTTLAESILYETGSIRKLGRVDHKNAFLDTYELERARGITIFSKQAEIKMKDVEVTLLDTPGHVDFSAEMERTIQVLDYAILVVSGSEGIQGHTETLWKLLSIYQIPTFIFVNKMDLSGADKNSLMQELKKKFNEGCVDFAEEHINNKAWMENLALCHESLLEEYMEHHMVNKENIRSFIARRKIFPCFFGSALRLEGVGEFVEGLSYYTKDKVYPNEFGAKVYKISRDEQGNRLTYMKITGGNLRVKMSLKSHVNGWDEKVDQIRIYSGTKYESIEEAHAGMVCAAVGLSKTYPGEGLGIEVVSEIPILEPVLHYQIILPSDYDNTLMLSKLRILEEEDPQLQVVWSKELEEIHVKLMGAVQVEILKSVILERFGVEVEFGPGNILYKETIKESVVGVGHYEPLRHYAEVHLLLEPGELGSGLVFESKCSEDILDKNWQKQVLFHLEDKEHLGVLTGSQITDMKITLITGRAHLKHTDGGDFRQATYRAVRQGLKKAKNVLLEPYYNFKLEVPQDVVGRAMSDISRMQGDVLPPTVEGGMAVLTGSVAVATMQGYHLEMLTYTKGRGKLFCTLKGYEPCHNENEVIESIAYDSERDLDNPTSSVFCSHGAGFVVPWNQVSDYMHLENGLEPKNENEKPIENTSNRSYSGSLAEDKELEKIFVQAFGEIKQRNVPGQTSFGYEKSKSNGNSEKKYVSNNKPPAEEYLLVDGYNIIFAWDELSELAKDNNINAARYRLMDILSNYQGIKKCNLILVFDAYKIKGGVEKVEKYYNINVVYTKERETADSYIEKTTKAISKDYNVTVATSDGLEQLIIMGYGAIRLSANDLKKEVDRVNETLRTEYLDRPLRNRNFLGEMVDNKLSDFKDEK